MPRPTIATLRALAAEKGFDIEKPIAGRDRYRLIWTPIGHAVKNAARGTMTFSVEEGCRFLAAWEVEDE